MPHRSTPPPPGVLPADDDWPPATRRRRRDSVILVALAVLGAVLTIAFGLWAVADGVPTGAIGAAAS